MFKGVYREAEFQTQRPQTVWRILIDVFLLNIRRVFIEFSGIPIYILKDGMYLFK